MATKQKQNEGLVIYEETLEGKESNVKIVIEIPKIQTTAQRYLQALKYARGIPVDLDAINPLDKMYQFALEKMPTLKGNPEELRSRVRYFYEQLQAGAYRDAVMLSVIASRDATGDFENKFNFEPKAYEEDESFLENDDLPGLVSPPKLKPNLVDPTEYRLKQFYDWLQANPEHLLRLQPALELAVIKVNELTVQSKTDEDGFRVKPTA